MTPLSKTPIPKRAFAKERANSLQIIGRPMLKRFFNDDSGATAIEYALICGLLFLAIVTALYSYGDSMGVLYKKIGDAIGGATS